MLNNCIILLEVAYKETIWLEYQSDNDNCSRVQPYTSGRINFSRISISRSPYGNPVAF